MTFGVDWTGEEGYSGDAEKIAENFDKDSASRGGFSVLCAGVVSAQRLHYEQVRIESQPAASDDGSGSADHMGIFSEVSHF